MFMATKCFFFMNSYQPQGDSHIKLIKSLEDYCKEESASYLKKD